VPHLQAVRIVTTANGPTAVVIEGDRPLPSPFIGVVTEGPPRIYFDFTGVVTDTTGIRAEGDPWIRRVRVAIHSQDPLVTRVVIDLFRATPHSVDANQPSPSQFVVSVGGGGPRPPVPAPKPRPAPARPEPGAAESPKPDSSKPDSPTPESAKPEVAKPEAATPESPKPESPRQETVKTDPYVKQASAVVARFEQLRPVLEAIDAQVDQQAVNLQRAVSELDAMRRSLNALRAPRPLQDTHDQLAQACILALRAVRTRMEFATTGNAPLQLNAASAAAGALMLMDRARTALGAPSDKGGPV
jgi:hypothetical protein